MHTASIIYALGALITAGAVAKEWAERIEPGELYTGLVRLVVEVVFSSMFWFIYVPMWLLALADRYRSRRSMF